MNREPHRRNLVLVASGLELAGGGRAVVGRLLARAGADYARRRGIGFSVLHLGSEHPPLAGVAIESFQGRRLALARAVWGRQLARPRPALLFDLLGPARLQAWLPPRLRSPYGVMLLGIEVFRGVNGARSRALRHASPRLAISAYTGERARRLLPAGEDGVAVVHLALEERPADGRPAAELLGRAGEGFLLIVGRMDASERYKGHDALLEALPRVLARCPAARLVVAGGGGDRPRLAAKAAELGLEGRVLFTGFVSEATLAELYRRSAVFVMPSRGEGFGLVYLEAMRASRPCVAARGGAAEEIVRDGETGLLVDAEDRDELAQALVRLLTDADRRREMGQAGRKRWAERFNGEAFRRRLFPHLDRLTALAGQGSAGDSPSGGHP